ncbi:ATP-binding cassette domain-containing protein [Candidatus Palauibacter sp.]|uniref:ATP-binding cassette domain-containing protein n=1 Tax=Candidatus Palauibacter sp. TaxID=3101350 RepID=UPI003B01FCC3
MSLVTLTDVVKRFGETVAVDSATFSIDRGEVVGFLGPNGAGKTTTMRLLTQYLEPDGGTITIDGLSIEDHPVELKRRIGYLPETNPLYRDMLAGEYISFMGRLRGLSPAEIRARTDDVVAETGIGEVYYRPINQLSKGYRQRVGLAQAILSEPEILILDEPTEGLDPNQRVEIRSLIRDVGTDRTVLLSTHVMQEVRKTCSRVVIINEGRIVADGSVDELVAGQGGARVIVELEGPEDAARAAMADLASVARAETLEDGVGRARFAVEGAAGQDPRADISRLAAARDWPLWELHLAQASLEDLFRQLTVTRAQEDPGGGPEPGADAAAGTDDGAGADSGAGADDRTGAGEEVDG